MTSYIIEHHQKCVTAIFLKTMDKAFSLYMFFLSLNIRYIKDFITRATCIVTLSLTLFSCENDVKQVQDLTRVDEFPVELQQDVRLIYTEVANAKLELKAPEIAKYVHEEEPYVEYPKGVEVFFYDEDGKVNSELKANYAIQHPKRNTIEARDDVVATNEKGERLNTEQLIWDQKKKIIYSDVFVRITTENQVIMGEGFEADQNFSTYKISKPRGTIDLQDEESTSDR